MTRLLALTPEQWADLTGGFLIPTYPGLIVFAVVIAWWLP